MNIDPDGKTYEKILNHYKEYLPIGLLSRQRTEEMLENDELVLWYVAEKNAEDTYHEFEDLLMTHTVSEIRKTAETKQLPKFGPDINSYKYFAFIIVTEKNDKSYLCKLKPGCRKHKKKTFQEFRY